MAAESDIENCLEWWTRSTVPAMDGARLGSSAEVRAFNQRLEPTAENIRCSAGETSARGGGLVHAALIFRFIDFAVVIDVYSLEILLEPVVLFRLLFGYRSVVILV